MTPITCAKPSPPRGRSPSSPTTRHGRSNIRSTSISMPSAISSNAASRNSSSSDASQPASKRLPEITAPSSLSQPSFYGCDKCPHHLARLQHRHAKAEINEQPAEHAVDPHHHALGAVDAGGCPCRKRRDAQAPQRAVENEDAAEQQEGEGLVRRVRRHELRQEGEEEQRHLGIEHIGECTLPEHFSQ